MIKKRHLIIAVAVTFVVTSILYNLLVMNITRREMTEDPVMTAKKLILSDYVDKLTDEQIAKLNDAAIDAMVKELGDPYSRYMSASDFENYKEEHEEDYIGIGIEIVFDTEEETMIVLSPYSGSPAQRAGIIPGDIITEVDGIAVNATSYDKIISHIRGEGAEEGAKVKIKVKRKDKDDEIEIEVIRERVEIQTVSFEKLEDNIGYIKIAEFKNRTAEEFTAALETLKDMEISSLIIDLRNNPGGYAHTVISMCDMLLPEGIIAYLEDSEGQRKYFNSDAKELGLPMAILINGGTASASELLAGSVQAYGLGTVIGEKSYGKAVGQSVYEIEGNSALYLTNSRYFTPKGDCIDGKGITPDIEIKLSDEKFVRLGLLEKEEDDQLMAAIETLTK